LWSNLATLPSAEPFNAGPGQVIAVVGSRRDALATASVLVERFAVQARDVIDEEPSSELRRRVQRRRTARATIVTVEGPVGTTAGDEIREWLSEIEASRVIAALGANSKRADVRRWLERLAVVDALACWRLGDSAVVADLMGLAPIWLLDGALATPMSWMSQLVGALGRLES
jgi:hypothetical protein